MYNDFDFLNYYLLKVGGLSNDYIYNILLFSAHDLTDKEEGELLASNISLPGTSLLCSEVYHASPSRKPTCTSLVESRLRNRNLEEQVSRLLTRNHATNTGVVGSFSCFEFDHVVH